MNKYNPLNRMVEKDLLPLLKETGCSFVAYNPLAAGLLTGKHQREGGVITSRLKNNQNYLPRVYTDENFDAIEMISAACAEANIAMVDATFAWLLRHSALTESDGVLTGELRTPLAFYFHVCSRRFFNSFARIFSLCC